MPCGFIKYSLVPAFDLHISDVGTPIKPPRGQLCQTTWQLCRGVWVPHCIATCNNYFVHYLQYSTGYSRILGMCCTNDSGRHTSHHTNMPLYLHDEKLQQRSTLGRLQSTNIFVPIKETMAPFSLFGRMLARCCDLKTTSQAFFSLPAIQGIKGTAMEEPHNINLFGSSASRPFIYNQTHWDQARVYWAQEKRPIQQPP